MRFKIRIKKGLETVAEVKGILESDVKVSELEKIIETEQFLERLTGLRVHIEESD